MAQEREQERRKRNMREALEGHGPMQDSPPPPAPRREPQIQPQSQPQERRVPEGVRSNLRYLSIVQENEVAQRTLVSAWFGEDFRSLSPSRASPGIHTEHPSYFVPYSEGLGLPVNGLFIPGTEDVHVSSDIHSREDRLRVIAHEDLHFFSRGGKEVSWGGVGGGTVRVGFVRWLNEGLTELFAQQVTRDHGDTPTYVAYPHETSAAFFLQTVVSAAVGGEARGRDILLAAYLTGDFTQVRAFVDIVLGPGTFDLFMAKDNGAEALAFIESKVAALGDTSMLRMRGGNDYRLPARWAENPILVMARIQMALGRSFSGLRGARKEDRPLGRD